MVEKEAPAGVGSGVVLIMAIVNVAIGASVSKMLIKIIDTMYNSKFWLQIKTIR